MKKLIQKNVVTLLSALQFGAILLILPYHVCAENTTMTSETSPAAHQSRDESCTEMIALLADQEKKISSELRMIKRDLAALSQKIEEPGMKDVLAGLGYILGLFGIAAFVSSRRNKTSKKS